MVFWFWVFSLLSGQIEASQKDLFGMGGQSTARVGSITASPENPYAAVTNPALLGSHPLTNFFFSSLWARTTYPDMGSIRVDSPDFQTETGTERIRNFTLPAQNQALWVAAINYPFLIPWVENEAGFGLTLSGPYDRLRTFEARTAYDFAPLHFATSDNQFKATAGFGLSIIEDRVRVGAALSLFLTTAGTVDAAMGSPAPVSRMGLDIGFNTALTLGSFFRLSPRTRLGLVWRDAIHPVFRQTVTGHTVVGQTKVATAPIYLTTQLYDEPAELEADVESVQGAFTFSIGGIYQDWKPYRPPVVELSENPSELPAFPPLSATLSPRISVSWEPLGGLRISGGYRFRPTPVGDLSGPTNLLDADTHVLGLAVDYPLRIESLMPATILLGSHAQHQWASERVVQKSSSAYIGAPGYRFAFQSWTYGLHLQMPL